MASPGRASVPGGMTRRTRSGSRSAARCWAAASASAALARAAGLGRAGRRVVRPRARVPGPKMPEPVVTRIAPSPTGMMHIGTARTALFNLLYARHTGGKFLLRIEDTDRERSTEPAIKAILDGLKWLELDWDGEPIYQAARAQRHREVAEELLAAGNAYRCYASPEELSQMREAAKKAGRSKLYDGRWRDRDPSEAPPGVKPVIRLKAPLDGDTVGE